MISCQKETNDPVDMSIPEAPEEEIVLENPLTADGILLGKMLFYDKSLSRDNTQSCASCHRQSNAFSDPNQFSMGINGDQSLRHSMPIFNMSYSTNGFFWDGRANLLRHQAVIPIQDPLEMDADLDEVMQRINADTLYDLPILNAFDTSHISEVTLGLALEQFMLSIESKNSKYDQYLAGEVSLTTTELQGRDIYFNTLNCTDCHKGFNFDDPSGRYLNNGLDSNDEFTDLGRALVTGKISDQAKFKIPSLRNVGITAPYMHDGRFENLDQVIEHYMTGIKSSSTLANNFDVEQMNLNTDERKALIDFLHTLTDEQMISNPAYFSPF